MRQLRHIVRWVGAIGVFVSLLFFWLIPPGLRGDALTWLGILISAVCTVAVVLARGREIASWPGFIALATGLLGAHLWLWWMWSWWESPFHLVRNLNTVVGLLAIDLLVALLIDALLLSIFRHAAPALMALVFVLYPLVLIGAARSAPDMETFLLPANERLQVLWMTPMVALPGVCCLSVPVFVVSLAIVVFKEFRGK
jgi:hypothetical protein